MTLQADIARITRGTAAGIGYLRRAGEGQALVLLHGIGSNAESFSALMKALPPSIDAIAWDAPGYGASTPLAPPSPSPKEYAAALEKFLDTLKLSRIALAGHSLGCLFSGSFAANYASRVSSLTLMSPALGYRVASGAALPSGVQSRIDEIEQLGPKAFAAQRAARLLRHIAEGDPVTNMSSTARALGINRTTLIRLLHTLKDERFIEPRNEGHGWRIGLGLIGLTAQAFFSEDLVQTSVPVLTRLAETLGLSAHLGVLDGTEIVYLVRRVPNHVFASNIRSGSRLPAHAANMGRIILANLPPERVDHLYMGTFLKPVTPRTAVTPAQLHAQLNADKAAGLAWSDGNYEAGISSVAAAVFDATDTPVAAVNVSGHSSDFAGTARRNQIAAAVKAASLEISQRLGWLGSDPTPRQHEPRAKPAKAGRAVSRATS